jgi:hypothetical protein
VKSYGSQRVVFITIFSSAISANGQKIAFARDERKARIKTALRD